MELLYLWIDDAYYQFNKTGFDFSDKYHINGNFDNGELHIDIKLNRQKVPNYFDATIANVTAILGANGVGKSNLLAFLTRLLTNSIRYRNLGFLVAFQHDDNILIYHSLFTVNAEPSDVAYTNKYDIHITSEASYSVERVEMLYNVIQQDYIGIKIPNLINSNLIYYSPAFDLRDVPTSHSFDRKPEIDVSTNSMVEADLGTTGDHAGSQILWHKLKNVERQFEMFYETPVAVDVELPTQLEVIFIDADVTERDLNFNSEQIFNKLKKLILYGYPLGEGDKHKAQIRFLDSLVSNFMDALSRQERRIRDILKVNVSEVDVPEMPASTEQVVNIIKDFFSKQHFIDGDFMLKMIDAVLHILENVDDKKFIDSNSFTAGREEVFAIWTWHLNYIERTRSHQQLMGINWRNMSTGEKAMLDLFSRIHFAKKEMARRQKSAGAKSSFIYILIDEGELGFHPLWQQLYFQRLHDFLATTFLEYSVQLFITSHSPILLSDLPAENALVLTREGNQVTVVKDFENRTLGSSITSLYENSFFLPKGIIGEFARVKLNELIKRINTSTNISSNEYDICMKWINAIGDPFLLTKLKEQLIAKLPVDEQIAALERQIQELKVKRDVKNL